MSSEHVDNRLGGVGRAGDYSLTNPRLDGLSIPDMIAYRHMLMSVIDALLKGRDNYGYTHPITIPITALLGDALKTIGKIDKRVIETLETTYQYTEERIQDDDLPF